MGRKARPIIEGIPEYNRLFTERLRELIAAHGMTHTEFHAEIAKHGFKMSYSVSSAWLRGERMPGLDSLPSIGHALLPGQDYRQVLVPSDDLSETRTFSLVNREAGV